MKKTFLICTLSAIMLTGCGSGVKPFKAERDTYSADLAVNSNEYSFILSKEIASVCSQIIAMQSNMIGYTTGNDNTNMIRACEQSLSTVRECKKVVQETRPSVGYEDDRETALKSIDNVIEILEKYNNALVNNKELGTFSKDLGIEYSILTSLQSVYYN